MPIYWRIYRTFMLWQFEITVYKSTPEQVLDKCSKCISYTCKRSSEETFAFCYYIPMRNRVFTLSHYVSIKTKYRIRLDAEADMIFSYRLSHQTLKVFLLFCKLILHIKYFKFVILNIIL